MKDRISDLHRQSSTPPEKVKRTAGDHSRPARRLSLRSIPWGMMTFVMAALFFAWRLTPPGFLGLPREMTYAAIMGGSEGRYQSEATNASANAIAAAEKAKADALAPIEVGKQVAITNQTAPIEIQKTVTITAEQAKIEQIKSCRVTMMQGAGEAYSRCVAGGYETGAACDARRDLILERLPDCGALPGEEAAAGSDNSAGGIQ